MLVLVDIYKKVYLFREYVHNKNVFNWDQPDKHSGDLLLFCIKACENKELFPLGIDHPFRSESSTALSIFKSKVDKHIKDCKAFKEGDRSVLADCVSPIDPTWENTSQIEFEQWLDSGLAY